jgi:hypothetical protein
MRGAADPRTTEGKEQVGIQVEESVARQAAPLEVEFGDRGFTGFAVAGTARAGEFRCSDCGYGAVVQRVLPLCPMCGGSVWETCAPRFAD